MIAHEEVGEEQYADKRRFIISPKLDTMEKNMLEKIRETADFILKEIGEAPRIGIILGTGLGDLVNHIEISKELNYKDIPNFPVSTVEGHSGKLIFGKARRQVYHGYAGSFPLL